MKKKESMIIYNLFPLLAGSVDKWEPHLKRASQMGFNWIFVNPIQLTGSSGSLYSIKDYFKINPAFVDKESVKTPEEQIRSMNEKAAKLGLNMMIDLVISHSSVDSDLIKTNPKWFSWEDGKVANPYCFENDKKVVWKDLAKFDTEHTHDPEGLFNFFSSVIDFLIDLGFKGFRCDAAYQIPKKLWSRLISNTKKKHNDICFAAETLGCTADQTMNTAKSGFSYIFNSSKWWDFHGNWLMAQYNLTHHTCPSISFPESHDTERLCHDLNGNIEGLKQRYLFSSLFSAGVMMPMGFEFGFRKKPHVVNTKPTDWESTNIDFSEFISKVNKIKATYSIFDEDPPMEVLNCNNPNILILWKASTTTNEEALLVLNKDIYHHQNFYSENIYNFIQSRKPLLDVSPEYPLDFIPQPFNYDLRPGQGFIFVTTRES